MKDTDGRAMTAPNEPAGALRPARGFATLDREHVRMLASRGGKAAHAQGVAHEFSPEEARVAGRKGGLASRRRRVTRDQQSR